MTAAGRHALALNGGLAALLLLLAAAGLLVGYAPLSPGDVWHGLTGADARLAIIVTDIRLPRVLLAAIIGGTLGLAGAALQGLLRNPLAEPGIIGVSASAALGAVAAMYFGLAAVAALALPLAALAGALVATLALYAIAARDASTLTLILAGVAISSLAVALTSLALNLAPSPFAVSELVVWLLGSLRDRSFDEVRLAAPFMAVGAAMLFATGRRLDALTLGEETARSLGVDMGRLRVLAIGGTACVVGAGVAVAGAVGFVGLVAPHLLRPLVAHEPSRLLLPSALCGAALVSAADLAARLMPGGTELQLGVVTALIGAPFFLYLILKTRRAMR
jgi:iron complex transport system permease protein